MTDKGMKKWRVGLGLLALFVMGMVTGLAGGGIWLHYKLQSFHREGPQAMTGLVIHLLDWKLDLTEAQEQSIGADLERVHAHMHRFKEKHIEEIRAILTGGLDRVQGRLAPDQLAAWREVRGEVEAHLGRKGGE